MLERQGSLGPQFPVAGPGLGPQCPSRIAISLKFPSPVDLTTSPPPSQPHRHHALQIIQQCWQEVFRLQQLLLLPHSQHHRRLFGPLLRRLQLPRRAPEPVLHLRP